MEATHDLDRRTLSVRALRKALRRRLHGGMKGAHCVLNPGELAEGTHHLCALAVMTKAPRTGQVKTRLAPPLTPAEAAALNACFLRDTANALCAAALRGKKSGRNARGIAMYTPVGSEDAYSDLLPCFDLVPQREGSFGERLFFAAEDLFKCGFDSACLIDSDSPTVPASSFAQAMELLSSPGDRVVLGPTDDGGYYLIGLKKPHRELFERIDWSTERVFEQTIARAQEIGVETKLLPSGYDVDDSTTLRQLCDDLLNENSPADMAPETRKFLKEIIEREGRERIWPLEK